MKFLFFALLLSAPCYAQPALQTAFESSAGNESAPYADVVKFYRILDGKFSTIRMDEAGPTDTDHPLHVVYYSGNSSFSPAQWRKEGKAILLINNGIHPGEPDGIDASMMLLRDAAMGKIKVPANVVLAVVPVFNIGGALNRGSHSRANQNGPRQYGFRGSAQNLDLNRDFTKMDALETRSLIRLIRQLDPDIFVDNHVSNGADYQHVMTLLSTQADKLGGLLGPYLRDTIEPALYAGMKNRGYDLVPYVNNFDGTPEQGWQGFLETPRFASGFAALFQTFAFVPETHMLKPYRQRVDATYALMQEFVAFAGNNAAMLHSLRKRERDRMMAENTFPIKWTVDTTQPTPVAFKGFGSGMKTSEVSSAQRLYYDRTKPFEKTVMVNDRYKAEAVRRVPKAYILPGGWKEVEERLKAAGVVMQKLRKDTLMQLTVYHIGAYETVRRPYEGHYLHYNIAMQSESKSIQLHRGDWIIPTAQTAVRYLVETLEPDAPDGFFAWNFFDAILQQKEHYSNYVFEDLAADLLKNDSRLRNSFEAAKAADTTLSKDAQAQLDWVYHNSPWYEPVHMRHPVFRFD